MRILDVLIAHVRYSCRKMIMGITLEACIYSQSLPLCEGTPYAPCVYRSRTEWDLFDQFLLWRRRERCFLALSVRHEAVATCPDRHFYTVIGIVFFFQRWVFERLPLCEGTTYSFVCIRIQNETT